jgi:ribonuclease BN (tRNA processing enzyme)
VSAPSLRFLGTGEAFDIRPHTSLLLRTASATLLLDCGALVPPQLWQEEPDAEALDGIWISHLHADHVFGLAGLLGRAWEEERRRPLTLLGGRGVLQAVQDLLDRGYPGLRDRFAFALEEVVVEPGQEVAFRGLALRSALSAHSLRNLALRIAAPGAVPLCYSGDGAPTEASAELGRDAVWIHECFSADRQVPGHATLAALEAELPRRKPRRVGLVHVSRRFRDAVAARAQALAAAGLSVSLPEPGEVWQLGAA